jgi:hypothetical protein
MALFTIIEEYNDLANKVRVRVDLVDESLFFKFQTPPTQDEVDWEVIAFLTAREVASNGPAD